MDYSLAEKEAVHEAFEQRLDFLDTNDQLLSRWEEDCLAEAIAAMTCGRYRVAAVHLTKAGAAQRDRCELLVTGLEATPQTLTKEDFRRGLAALRGMPSEDN